MFQSDYADIFCIERVNPDHEGFVEAATAAGKAWAIAGNDKLPSWATINGKQVKITGSVGDASHAFINAWRTVRGGDL